VGNSKCCTPQLSSGPLAGGKDRTLTMLIKISILCIHFLFSPAKSDTSVVITLERGECFGTCPQYKIVIFGSGQIVYEGYKFVNTLGTRKYTIAKSAVDSLVRHILRIDYFSLDNSYTKRVLSSRIDSMGNYIQSIETVTDRPTTITSFRLANRYKRVVDYYGAPEKLRTLEQAIDQLARTRQLVGEN
jgi:hypothetical protein